MRMKHTEGWPMAGAVHKGVLALAVLVVASLVASPGSGATGSVGSAKASTGDGTSTIQECVVANQKLDVVLLVDESGSLSGSASRPGTDPDDLRIGGLKAVIDSIAVVADVTPDATADRAVDTQILIAGFGEGFEDRSGGWKQLNSDNLDELYTVAEGFRDRDGARDTDYLLAYEGAADALARQAAARSADGPTCPLLVVFSDGEYSIGRHPGGETKPYAPETPLDGAGDSGLSQRRDAVQRGMSQLCAPDGAVQRLREAGTVTFGLGLKLSPEASPRAELEDTAPLDFFTSVVTGSSGTATCGDPDSSAYGVVTNADEVRRLAVEIFCALNSCEPSLGRATVEVDRSVVGLRGQVASAVEGFGIRVSAPSGEVAQLAGGQAGSSALGSSTLGSTPQSGQLSRFSAEFDPSSQDQVGTWTVEITDPSGTPLGEDAGSIGLSRLSGLAINGSSPGEWEEGEPGRLSAQLVVGDGNPVSPAELSGELTIEGSVTPPGSSDDLGIEASIVIDPETGEVQLTTGEIPETNASNALIRISATGTYGDGTPRNDIEYTATVPIRRGGLPYLVDVPRDGLRLSGVEGGGGPPVAVGEVTARADDDAPGRVCIEGFEHTEFPDDAGPPALDGSPCLDLEAGEQGTLEVRVAADDIRSGRYGGVVAVGLSSPSVDEPRNVEVPAGFAGYAPVCTSVLIGVIVGILAGVILIALLLLFVLSRRAARFPEDLSIQYMEIPILVRNGTVFRDDGESPVAFAASVTDIDTFLGATSSKKLLTCSLGTTISTTPRMFGLPVATFRWPDHEVIGSADGFLSERGVWTRGNVSLGLSGSWVFGLEDVSDTTTGSSDSGEETPAAARYEVRGRIWLFVDTDPGREQRLARTVEAVQGRLPGMHLYSLAAEHAPEQPADASPSVERTDDELSGGAI